MILKTLTYVRALVQAIQLLIASLFVTACNDEPPFPQESLSAKSGIEAAEERDRALVDMILASGSVPVQQLVAGTQVNINAEGNCLSAEDIEYVVEQTELAIRRVPEVLGRSSVGLDLTRYGENALKLNLYFAAGKMFSHVYGGYHAGDLTVQPPAIFFSCILTANRKLPLVHEYTHLYEWRYWSGSLREGIADYTQFTLTPDTDISFTPRFTDWHVIQHDLYRAEPKSRELVNHLGEPGYPFEDDQTAREWFYDYSRSFVYHLVQTFGVEVLVAVQEDKTRAVESYLAHMNSNITELQADYRSKNL